MKEIISKLSATTVLLVYLFFCGTLYIISYWSTFDFDITNYIELLDIPKSFVFPLATGIGISLLMILIQAIFHSIQKVKKDDEENKKLLPKIKELPTKFILLRILKDYNTWVIIILSVCFIFYKPRREWVIAVSSIVLILFGIVKFIRHSAIIKKFPDFRLRFIFSILFFFIPIFSFTTGKLNAIEVWKNQKYFQITDIFFKEDSISNQHLTPTKFLGKLGTNLFVSDSLNSKITIINSETIKYINFTLVDKNSLKSR